MKVKAKVCLGAVSAALSAIAGCGCGMHAVPPPPVPASSRFLYVVNSIQGSVSGFSIDARSGALTSVGAAVPADDSPIYAAATPDGKFLYVANANSGANGVSGYRIDPMSGVLTPTSPAAFGITGDSDPFGIVVDSSSTHVYTANPGSVSAFTINPATGALADVPGTPVSSPSPNSLLANLALTPNDQFLYATDSGNNIVWAYTLSATGLPRLLPAPILAGTFPQGIVVDPSGRFVYVANWQSDDLSVYTITGTGMLLSAARTTPVARGCGPQELAVDPAGKFLFVSCSGLGTIARFAIDATTGALTQGNPAFSTGQGTAPRGLAVDASGLFLYSAWNTQNRAGVAAIGANGTLTPVLPNPATGRGPLGVVVSGRQ